MLINEQIADENLFVIDETGKNIGILNKNKALELAKKKKLDLVLFTQAKKLNEKSIAKIIDYKKFLYQQQIKEKLIRKKNNINNKIKELKIKPVIDSHDVEWQTKKIIEWLKKSYIVKLKIQTFNHIIKRQELINEIYEDILNRIKHVAKIQSPFKKVSNYNYEVTFIKNN